MLNKKNYKDWTKKTILFILTLSLWSCSTIGKLWYERLDIYLANYFFEYTDFTNKQSNNIRKVTKDFKEWNSRFELPKYKNFLDEIIKLNREISVRDVEKIFDESNELFESNYAFFIPHIVIFSKTLNDQQIDEIDNIFQKRIKKWEEDWISEKKNYNDEVVKSYTRLARFVGIKLSAEQKEEIRIISKGLEDKTFQLIRAQESWNNELISLLKSREDNDFDTLYQNHLDSLFLTTGREEQKVYAKMITKTISSLDDTQIKKFKKRLTYFISSLDKIIKSQK